MKFDNWKEDLLLTFTQRKDKIKSPLGLVSRGIEVYTVVKILLPLLTEQVFTGTQMSGMCWNL